MCSLLQVLVLNFRCCQTFRLQRVASLVKLRYGIRDEYVTACSLNTESCCYLLFLVFHHMVRSELTVLLFSQ